MYWWVRQISAAEPGKEEDDWRSVFMGLAFDGERALYASEGNSGRVRLIDPATGEKKRVYDLNGDAFRDSYTGDLALDRERGFLYVLDQANFRLAVIDLRRRQVAGSLKLGRLPFAIALSPDGRKAYVTNLGMFQYQPVPGADPRQARETGLPFPAFGFPSPEAQYGARRETASRSGRRTRTGRSQCARVELARDRGSGESSGPAASGAGPHRAAVRPREPGRQQPLGRRRHLRRGFRLQRPQRLDHRHRRRHGQDSRHDSNSHSRAGGPARSAADRSRLRSPLQLAVGRRGGDQRDRSRRPGREASAGAPAGRMVPYARAGGSRHGFRRQRQGPRHRTQPRSFLRRHLPGHPSAAAASRSSRCARRTIWPG